LTERDGGSKEYAAIRLSDKEFLHIQSDEIFKSSDEYFYHSGRERNAAF
jgi:hypothetical protein